MKKTLLRLARLERSAPLKRALGSMILLSIVSIAIFACSQRPNEEVASADACVGIDMLEVPNSALFGQWRESELVEMRSGDQQEYWIRRNHVLSREGQLTTREEYCADLGCMDVKAELTHFGSYVFDSKKHTLLKSYRNHFYAARDAKWMGQNFELTKCPQISPSGDVVTLDQDDCLSALNVKKEETWQLQGATLKSLALRNCGPQLRADSHLTRELVRMF